MTENRGMNNWSRSWTLALAAILALGLASCSSDDRAGEETGGEPGAGQGGSTSPGNADLVGTYIEFARNAQGLQGGAADPAVIADGLRRLAGVMGTLDGSRPELMTDLRASAEHVLLNPDSPDVAATVREAVMEAAKALQMVEASSGAAALKAAENIRADMPLTGQPAALRQFFQQAASVFDGGKVEGSAPAPPS